MPEQHAFLSPSGAKLWLQSPACWYKEAEGLSKEEQEFVDSFELPSTAADEGTLGHEIVERILSKEYDKSLDGTKPLRTLRKSKFYSYELERYAKWVAKQTIDLIDEYDDEVKGLHFEMRVHAKSIHKDLWGTSDVVIVTDDTLHIVDFKFGRLPVPAIDNPQLKIYAFAALETLGLLRQVKTVRGTILQPRNYDRADMEIKKTRLSLWAKARVKPRAIETAEHTGPMLPSVETCRYCKHRVTDAKHRAAFLNMIKWEEGRTVKDLDLKEIEDIAANAAALKQWIDDVVKFAQGKAYGGQEFTKVKLVRGYTRRSFSDTKRVQRRLKRLGYEPDQYMKQPDVKPLTEIEALLGKTKFNSSLGPLIKVNENKPRLVSIESKEAPIQKNINEVADEFGI